MESKTFYDSPMLEYLIYVGLIFVVFFHIMNKTLPENQVPSWLIRQNLFELPDCVCDGR